MHANIRNTQVHTLLEHDRAEEEAARLNANPTDDWTYRAVHDPSGRGKSYIEARDEHGVVVGKL